jgi:hypothetical protein
VSLKCTPDGDSATVAAVTTFAGDQSMYNLTVEGTHTYYVVAGHTPVLVHNYDCGNVIDILEGNSPEILAHNKLVKGRASHVFDSHAFEWFGLESNDAITAAAKPQMLKEWDELVRFTARSDITGVELQASDKLLARFHLAKKNGKWFMVRFYIEGPRKGYLSTAFMPSGPQLERWLKLAGVR